MFEKAQSISSDVKVFKAAILKSQFRTVLTDNQELLTLHYGIGRFVS